MDAHQTPTREQLALGEYANLLAQATAELVDLRVTAITQTIALEEAEALRLELEARLGDNVEPAEDLDDYPPIGEGAPS